MQHPFHHLARAIITMNGKILIAQANGHKNSFLPGGHIEFGESAKDALVREIQEELAISCEVHKFLGVVEHKWEKNGVVHVELNQVFEVTSSDLQSNVNPTASEAHLQFFWVNAEQLEQIQLQPYPFKKLIQAYLNGNNEVWWASTLNNEIDDNNRNN